MAIFGIGAAYGGTKDVSSEFIEKGLACTGWKEKDAPALLNLFKHIRTGDIIYIKSHPPSIGLIIKAVGIVTGDRPVPAGELGTGVRVKWVWQGDERLGKIKDGYSVRSNTLFEEYNYEVQSRIIELLLKEK